MRDPPFFRAWVCVLESECVHVQYICVCVCVCVSVVIRMTPSCSLSCSPRGSVELHQFQMKINERQWPLLPGSHFNEEKEQRGEGGREGGRVRMKLGGGKWGRDWSELAARGRGARRTEEGWWMEGLSVTDAMANYSLSALRCTAGGACSVLSGRRISLHPPFALRSRKITAECTT